MQRREQLNLGPNKINPVHFASKSEILKIIEPYTTTEEMQDWTHYHNRSIASLILQPKFFLAILERLLAHAANAKDGIDIEQIINKEKNDSHIAKFINYVRIRNITINPNQSTSIQQLFFNAFILDNDGWSSDEIKALKKVIAIMKEQYAANNLSLDYPNIIKSLEIMLNIREVERLHQRIIELSADSKIITRDIQNLLSHQETLFLNLPYLKLNNIKLDSELNNFNFSCAHLLRADFRSSFLKHGDFQAANLVEADLSHTNITDTNFNYANLLNADFSFASIDLVTSTAPTVTFYQADLYQAKLRLAYLPKTCFVDANLSLIDATDAIFRKADFEEADLSSANLKGASFKSANLKNTNCNSAIFTKTNLCRAILDDAILSSAEFSQANLVDAKLRKADLSDATLSKANLECADLSNAKLISANLINANLIGATLFNTDFSLANLQNADLSETDLRKANLSDTDLRSANLKDANLRDACLNGADLRGAIVENTILDFEQLEYCQITDDNGNADHFKPVFLEESDLKDIVHFKTKLSKLISTIKKNDEYFILRQATAKNILQLVETLSPEDAKIILEFSLNEFLEHKKFVSNKNIYDAIKFHHSAKKSGEIMLLDALDERKQAQDRQEYYRCSLG